VTVVDTTAPAITCPADVVVECNAQGQATGVSAGAATATEVCSSATVTDPAAASYPLGATTVTHTAKDAAGNTSSCTNKVTVRDTTPPVFNAATLGAQTLLGNCSGAALAVKVPTATDVCQSVTVTCAPLAGNSFGSNVVTCTARDAAGNTTTASITVNVLQPLRLAFQSPLSDDNVANDINTDADISNVFQVKSTIPHKIKIFACNGNDITASVASSVTLRLTVNYRNDGSSGAGTAIVPTYNGQGDAGGVFAFDGSQFHYNLSTDPATYPTGSVNNSNYFDDVATATYNVLPGVVAGQEDARLESK
jgi:hypothetical protein